MTNDLCGNGPYLEGCSCRRCVRITADSQDRLKNPLEFCPFCGSNTPDVLDGQAALDEANNRIVELERFKTDHENKIACAYCGWTVVGIADLEKRRDVMVEHFAECEKSPYMRMAAAIEHLEQTIQNAIDDLKPSETRGYGGGVVLHPTYERVREVRDELIFALGKREEP